MLLRLSKYLYLILIISFFTYSASALENCEWDNKNGVPCLTVNKTPNTSKFNQNVINKIIITKEDIISSGAVDTKIGRASCRERV